MATFQRSRVPGTMAPLCPPRPGPCVSAPPPSTGQTEATEPSLASEAHIKPSHKAPLKPQTRLDTLLLQEAPWAP